ncbi:thiol reductant ABC exporter subunit CydD [Arhodomonas aquaeolei]|uniref:thiol reductant ABC exporter subunit CydD n=1 Tax=Arhodomonas aquaeolei TaxID=2369 RepID=UPI0021672DE8|nr:thiol reductant ABC exporter subunit CydD [Arhodomonas aquaeolei]MCS4504487.1 thiol reductant ABC exporter subunit CydD [Arhodomonas aquaeolei]
MAGETTPRRWLDARARCVRGPLVAAVAAGLVQTTAVIIQAGTFAWIVAAMLDRGVGVLTLAFVVLVAAVLVRAGAEYARQHAGVEAGLRVRGDVRRELLARLDALGPMGVAAEPSAGLASRVVEQAEALEGYYARFLPQMVLAVVSPLAILVVVAWMDWLAALFLVASAPLIPLFMALVGMGAERLNRAQFRDLSRLSGHFLDRIRGLSTLALFDHGERSIEAVAAAADGYRRRSLRTLRVAFLSSAVLEFFSSVAIAVVAIYIGFGLLGYIAFGPAPALTLFSGLFILLLAPEFFQPLRTLSQHYHDRAAAVGAAAELMEVLERPSAVSDTADAALPPGALELAAVAVGRGDHARVFGPLSLSVPAGSCVVITGATGAGKTTLLRLIAGFQAPDEGRVRAGGDGAVAWLGQRPLVVPDTLAGNIRLGSAQPVDDDAVHEAARRAGVLAFAEAMPDGLDSRVGERGYGISGGQAQRLALARVFVSSAPLVLLDEPTSALDAATRQQVVAGLAALREAGRTLVIASHDPVLTALADRVVHLAGARRDVA